MSFLSFQCATSPVSSAGRFYCSRFILGHPRSANILEGQQTCWARERCTRWMILLVPERWGGDVRIKKVTVRAVTRAEVADFQSPRTSPGSSRSVVRTIQGLPAPVPSDVVCVRGSGKITMSNANKKPTPLYNSVARAACPVCGHASYSSTGIHPQCAMQAADVVHIARVNARKLSHPVAVSSAPRPFEKRCPRCRGTLPARSLACTCGHNFKP